MSMRASVLAVIAFLAVIAAGFVVLGVSGQALASPAADVGLPGAGLNALYDVHIDAGSTVPFTDLQGNVWQADQAYSAARGWGYTVTGLTQAVTNRPISGTNNAKLYQANRYWNSQTGVYRFDAPRGNLFGHLRFADLNGRPARGYRYLDVDIAGAKYLCNMDIIGSAGPYETYDWTFVVTVTNGPLNISFIPHQN